MPTIAHAHRSETFAAALPLTHIAQGCLAGLLMLAHNAHAQQDTVLPSISVKGTAEQETATGPVQGYVANRAATATKTDTPILETPQSISVIGGDELAARGVTTVTEAMRYVPGVLAETFGQDDRGFEGFTLRGFYNLYAVSYLDGLRQPGASFIVPQNEPYGLERIEVLRGPSSVMYGQGDAGGVIARVSKRPHAETRREVQVQLGNLSRKQVAADLGGALDKDGRLAYRVVTAGLEHRPQIDYPGYEEHRTRRFYVAPSLSWNPSADTSFVVLTDFLGTRGSTNPTEYLGPNQQRTRVLTGDPTFDGHAFQQWSAGYQFSHRFHPDWTFRQNLRTSTTDLTTQYVYGWGVDSADAAGDVSQTSNRRAEAMRYTTLDNQIQGKLDVAGTSHTLLAGVEWLRYKFGAKAYAGAAQNLNIFNPVYGQGIEYPNTPSQDSQDSQRQLGFYVQDQVKLGTHWRLSAGLRRDTVRGRTDDFLNAASTPTRDAATTGRLGATYVTGFGLAPYVSYAESFLPEAGTDFFGNPFKPSKGKQYEAGLKYQPANGKVMLSAAVFDLTKRNVLTRDPNPLHEFASVQTGEVRSRGLELEVKGEVLRGLNLSAQYSLTNTEVTQSNDVDLGKRPINVPKHLASAWGDYRLADTGVRVGAGIRHVGKRFADNTNTVTVPSQTLVDAALHYDVTNWGLSLNVNNLLNKDYIGTLAYGYYPGARRTVVLTGRYRF